MAQNPRSRTLRIGQRWVRHCSYHAHQVLVVHEFLPNDAVVFRDPDGGGLLVASREQIAKRVISFIPSPSIFDGRSPKLLAREPASHLAARQFQADLAVLAAAGVRTTVDANDFQWMRSFLRETEYLR